MTRPLRHPLIWPQPGRRRHSPRNSVATLALMVSGALLPASQAAGQIVADGNTATTVSPGAGTVTNITTGTISGNHGVNTFSSFSTAAGSVTNIHVPTGATGTVNIVNGPRSVIDGAVNSVRNGSIGGDLHFANPAGIVIGPGGGFHCGSVSLSTPSQDFVRQIIQPGGGVSAGHVQQLVGGVAPLGQGDIIIHGQLRGQNAVRLRAGGDVVVAGGGQVRAHQGGSGGNVTVRAGRDVRVRDGAVILAQGEGAGQGGTIDVFAANAAILELGGRVSVAAYGSGDGGFVEFSAEKAVEVHGLLQAWSEGGRGGTVFIDPEHLTITGEITAGANFRAEATASITVQSGAIISTRRVSGDASDDEHANAASIGASGDIELTAPSITIQSEAQLLAFADQGHDGGSITLTAARIDRDGHLTQALPVSSTSINIEQAYLRAQNIIITAETAKFNQVDAEENINAYLSGLIPDGLPLGLSDTLLDLGQQAASRVQSTLDAVNYDNWPGYLEARAEIGVNRATLHADGSIRIASSASAETEITPATGGMALVIAASNTVARSVVTNSVLVAEGDVSITSDTFVDHKLRAEGVPGGGLEGLNTALVASVRMGGAETVLGGFPGGAAWLTQSFLPDGVTMNRNAVIQSGGDITLGALNTSDLSLQADTVLGENGRGAAIVLSLDDRSAFTAAGGKIWSNRMALDVHARNVYRKVLIEARVTGGAMQADDAPSDAVAGQPDAQQDVMASVLGGVAASAEGGSGVGQTAGITQATQDGDVADRAYAASFALANHNATARVVLGDTDYIVSRPGGGTAAMRAFDFEPMGGFVSGTTVIPPTITRDFDAQQDAITILAENVLQDVRQRAIAAAGELPDPGEDASTAAKRAGLVAISFADWDLDALIDMGSGSASISQIVAGGGINITARNVAPDFADRAALADAHDLYSGKRQAEDPATGTDDDSDGDDQGTTPNQGGLLGAWSDGEGPLFSRAGEEDDDPLALSVAQTFAAGEALGVGISLARLSGDQTARVDLRRGVWISAHKEPITNTLEVQNTGEIAIIAAQSGAWGASAGAPGQATGAGEGGAYGASIALVNIEATTEAVLREPSQLSASGNDKGARILAQDTRLVSADARTHGAAGKTSFSGALSLMQRRDTVRALIGPRWRISLDGALSVKAENSGDTITVVSAAASGRSSIGVGIALTFADRTTTAGLVSADMVDEGSFWNVGETDIAGLKVEAVSTGNVISGGRTQAGELPEAGAGENGGAGGTGTGGGASDPEEEDDTDAPVALDADAIGDDSTRVADAIGGSNPLGGGGGGGGDEDGGLAFAGDFGAIFSDVTTEALVIGRDFNAGLNSGPINVKTTGEVTISSRTAINYGQSSAVTAAASGGVGIAGSFGLTWVEHDTATRLLDSEILFGPNFADEKQETKPVRITSADESRFDLLVDGRAGRADGGWSFAIAASFARFVTLTQTEIASSAILMGRAPDIMGGGLNGWYYNDFEGGGWYNDGSGDWEWNNEEGWVFEIDRGWFISDWGGYVYVGDKTDDGSDLPPGYCDGDVCGPTGPPSREVSPDGRDIVISSLADPTLTIRASSQRTGPTGSGSGGGDADGQQMDAVGDLTRDAGNQANEKGGDGLKGLSITVAPLRQIANASVLVRDSRIEAQLESDGTDLQDPGKLGIDSRARTNLDIDASSDSIAIGLAITDTFSRVEIDRTHLTTATGGNVTIRSRADEKHKMTATAGAERAIKAAGILSLRSVDNRVLVGTRDDLFTQTQIRAGGQILVAAESDHDLDFRVIAADGTPSALALAGLISLSDTVTEAAVSGQYFSDDEVVVSAINTYSRYRAVAIASAGSTVPGAEPSPPADPSEPPDPAPDNTERDPAQGATTNALLDVADATQDTVSDEEEEGTGSGTEPEAPAPRASRMTAFSIAFVLDLHKDNTSARIAASRVDDPLGAPLPSGPPNGASFDALTDTRPNLVLRAENRINAFHKEARAAIGAGDQAPDRGAVFAVTLGDWQLHADATMGQAVSTYGRTVSVTARTVLPTVSAELNRADWLEDVGDLFADGAGGYASGDARPKSADELVSGPDGSDEDDATAGWNIITSTQTDFNKLGLAIDVSITRLRSSAHAKVLEGGAPRVANTLNVTAETTGGLASRRDPVGQEVGSDGSGAGGSGHVLLLHSDTLAQIGAQPQLGAPDYRTINTINVSARTDMRAAVAASSFGQSESVALNIAFAMIDYDARTHARIVSPEQLIVQNTYVRAEDSSLLLVDAGSSAAGNTSIGVSAGLIFGDRDVLAEIAGEGSTGTFNLGDITVEAELRGGALITTQAGAGGDEDEEEETPTPPAPDDDDDDNDEEEEGRDRTALPTALLGDRAETNADDLADQTVQTDTEGAGGTDDTTDDTQGDATQQSPVEGKSFGFALAGDFSGMFGRSHSIARIDHAAGDLNAGDVTINAINNQALFAASGSAVGGAGSVGIGASVSLSNVERITRAMMAVRNGELSGDHLRILAQDATQLRLFAAGRGGAAVNINVMGSAAVEYGSQTVEAGLRANELVLDWGQMLRDADGDTPPSDDGNDADDDPKGIVVRARAAGSTLALAGAFKPVDGQDPDSGGGVSIGLAFAGSFARETIHAHASGTFFAPEMRILARRAGYIGALASSSGAADGFALAGAAAATQIRRDVRAEAVDAGFFVTGDMEVIASDRADTRLRVGSDSESDTVSVGLAGAIALERRSVIAELRDSYVYAFDSEEVGALTVRARQDGLIDALQLGGGDVADDDDDDDDSDPSGFSASIGLGLAYTTRQTHARLENSDIYMGDVTVEALQSGRIRNRQGVTEAIGFGGSVGVILSRLQSDVLAEVTSGGISAEGDLKITAIDETTLLSRSAKTGEGDVAIDIMVATTTVTGAVRAEASQTYLDGATVEIAASDRTTLQSAALAQSETSTAGGIGGVAFAANRLNVHARAIQADVSGHESFSVRAQSESELSGTVVGLMIGDGFTGALQSAWLTANRDVTAEVEWVSTTPAQPPSGSTGPNSGTPTAPPWAGDVEIEATRNDTLMGISVTAADASASVGIGANVLQTGGRTLAELRLDGLHHSLIGDVSVTARDSSKALTVAIGAAGGGGFSLVGSLAYLQMGRRPADAVLTESDGRSDDHQQQTEATRDEVGDGFASEAYVNATELRRRFDLATEARVAVGDGATVNMHGDLSVRVDDNRQATALAGQIQINMMTGGATEKALDLFQIDENGISVDIKDIEDEGTTALSSFSLRGDGKDGAGVGEAGAQADSTGGDGENGSGSVGIGLAFGWVRLGGAVVAEVQLGQESHLDVANSLSIRARNLASAAGVSVGAQMGGSLNLGAGAGIARHDQFVRARITGTSPTRSVVSAESVNLLAESQGRNWAMAGLVTGGDGVAAGATLAVSNLDAVTEAVITHARVITTAATNVTSRDTSRSLALALTGGVSTGGAAIGASVGVNLAQSDTRALVRHADIQSGGDLAVRTTRAQVMNSYVLQVAISSGSGIGAAISVAQQKGNSAAEIISSNVDVGGNTSVISAGANTIGTVAVSASGGGGLAVAGSVSITISEAISRARIDLSDIEAGGVVLVEARSVTQVGGLAGGDDDAYRKMDAIGGSGAAAVGGGLGVGVSVAVLSLASETFATIDRSVVRAMQDPGATAVMAAQIGPSGDQPYALTLTMRDGVGVVASNRTFLRGLTITVGIGGTAGVALQVPVVIARDDATARIARSRVISAGDVFVNAFNSTDMRTFSAVLGVGGTAGVGALVEVGSYKKTTVADIFDSEIEAEADVEVKGVAVERLATISFAAGAGGVVGVAGVVQSIVTRNATYSGVRGVTIDAGGKVDILAVSDRELDQDAGTVAGAGIAGVGAAVLVLKGQDETVAEVTDGTGYFPQLQDAPPRQPLDGLSLGGDDTPRLPRGSVRPIPDDDGLVLPPPEITLPGLDTDPDPIGPGGTGGGVLSASGGTAGGTLSGQGDEPATPMSGTLGSDEPEFIEVIPDGPTGLQPLLDARQIDRGDSLDLSADFEPLFSRPDGVSIIRAGSDITVDATSELRTRTFIAGAAVSGIASVSGSILVASFDQVVLARVGDWSLLEAGDGSKVDGLADVSILANQYFDQNVTLGAAAVSGVVGVAASIGAVKANNTVLAAVGANAEVTASRDILIRSHGQRDFNGVAITAGAAFGVGISASVLAVSFAALLENEDSDDTLNTIYWGMQDDPFRVERGDQDQFDEGEVDNPQAGNIANDDAQLGGLLAEARADRESIDLGDIYNAARRDGILTSVGEDATLTAGRDLRVIARERGDVQITAGAVAVAGLAGVSAGVTSLRRGTNVQVDVQARAQLVSLNGDVRVGADVRTDDGNTRAVSGGRALGVSGAGAISTTTITRIMRVDLGNSVIMSGHNVDVFANEIGQASAFNIATSEGVVGLGATYAMVRRESHMTINLRSARITGHAVNIHADRVGDMAVQGVAVAGGVVAGVAGVVTQARDDSTVLVNLRDAALTATADLDIRAVNTGAINSYAEGVALSVFSGAAAGASLASATRTAEARVTSQAADLTADRVFITTRDAEAQTLAGAGSVSTRTRVSVGAPLGAAISAAEAQSISATRSEIDVTLAQLQAVREIVIDAQSNAHARADATDTTIGNALAKGTTIARVFNDNMVRSNVVLQSGAAAAERVAILATGRDYSLAQAKSTKGAIGATLSASVVELRVNPITQVSVSGDGLIDSLGEVEIRGDRISEFLSTLDTRDAAVFRRSRGEINTIIGAVMDVTVGADITAPTITLAADQKLLRPDIGYNAETRGGSAVGVVSLRNWAYLDVENRLTLQDATLTERASPVQDGRGIELRLHNDVDATDRLAQQAFTLLGQNPGIRSEVQVFAEAADIVLDGATLDGIGDIAVHARNDVNVVNEAYMRYTGAVTASTADTYSYLKSAPSVTLVGNSALTSRAGSVYLLAGRDILNNQIQTVRSENRTWMSNILSTADLYAASGVDGDAAVTLGNGVQVRAARDVTISAVQGIVDAYGYYAKAVVPGVGDADRDALNALGEQMVEQGFSATQLGGFSELNGTPRLHLDGDVAAGAFALQQVIVNPVLSLTLLGDTDTVSVEVEQDVLVNADLAAFIAEKQAERALLDGVNGASDLRVRLDEEIAQLQIRLQRAGGADATGPQVTLAGLHASGGNVELRGQEITGSGALNARGDARIEVENSSAATMVVDGAVIPFRAGGEIVVNSVPVTSNAAIADQTRSGTLPGLALTSTPSSDALPLLSLRGTYIAPANSPRSNLIVTGNVENLNGRLELTTLDGDILLLGANILGREVMVGSGGDFFMSATPGVTSAPRNPAGLYRDFFAQYEALSALQYMVYRDDLAGGNLSDLFPIPPLPDFAVDTQTGGLLRALGGVYIYADRLNIDGTIQSGETNWSLDIHPDLEARLALLNTTDLGGQSRILIYDPTRLGDQIGREIVAAAARPYITGSGVVWYDVSSNTLEVGPMLTRGGHIELVGRIMSTGGQGPTGNAVLRVANGFGQVNIDNATALPLVLSALDTGVEGMEGTIRIVDLNDVVRAGVAYPDGSVLDPVYRTTTFRFRNGQIEWSRTILVPTLQNDGTFGDPMPLQSLYAPISGNQFEVQNNEALEFTNLRLVETVTLERQIRTERFILNDYETDEVVRTDSFVTVLDEELLSIATPVNLSSVGLSADLPYIYSRDTTEIHTNAPQFMRVSEREPVEFILGVPVKWESTWERTVTTEVEVLDTHHLVANRPLDLQFAGFDEGLVNITSRGDVRLDGLFYNPSGATNITSTEGSILTTAPGAIVTTGNANFTAAQDIAGAAFEVPMRSGPGWPFIRIRPGTTERVATGFMLLDQPDGATMFANATGDVLLRALDGDLRVNTVTGRDVRLHAPGSILGNSSSALVTAERAELVARSGRIGGALDSVGSFLNLAISERLDAEAFDSIRLNAPGFTGGRMPLGRIQSLSGDVWLRAGAGGIIDANPDEVEDRRARDNLLEALWDELGLRRTTPEADAAREADAVADLLAAEADDYAFYWSLRRLVDPDTGDIKEVDFDPALLERPTEAQVALRIRFGETLDEIEADHQAEIARFIAAHERFGDQPFDEDRQTKTDSFTVDPVLIAERIADLFLTDRQLGRGIREDLVLDITDTVLVIEAPNIVAHNADLRVLANGSIGQSLGELVLTPETELTEDIIAALWTAERDDLIFEPGGIMRIRLYDDVDVQLSGRFDASARDVLIGSESDLRLGDVEAAEMLRIKTAQSLLNGNQQSDDAVRGRAMVLEAGAGSIGSAALPLQIAQTGAQPFLDARAAGGIWLTAQTGDLHLGQVFSQTGIQIAARMGDILGLPGVGSGNLRAPQITLNAVAGNIGAPDGSLAPRVAALGGGDLPLDLSAAGNLAFDIAQGSSVTLPGFTPLVDGVTRSLRIGGDGRLELNGDVSLTEGGDIVLAVADLETRGNSVFSHTGDISLALSDGAELQSGLVRSNRGNVTITGAGDLGILGVIDAVDGDLEVIVGGQLTTGLQTLLRAPNGKLSLTLRDHVGNASAMPLQTEVAALDVFAYSDGFALQNTAPVLTLGDIFVEGLSAQIGTSGRMVLAGDIAVVYPDSLESVLLLVAGQGLRSAGGVSGVTAGQAYFYALEDGIGEQGNQLSLDMRYTERATFAALGGDVVLDVPFGVTADVITAADGNVHVSSEERIRVDLVGSLEEPDFRVPAGSEIGPWGGPSFDMAEATGLGDWLHLAGLNTDAAVPGPSAPPPGDDKPGDGDDKPGDGDDEPGDGDDKPGDGDDEPGDGDDKPGDGDDEPGDGDDEPGDGDDKPGDGDDEPGDGDDKPGDGDDESGDGDDKPGDGDDEPGDGDDEPGDGDDKPGDGDDKPGEDQPTDGQDRGDNGAERPEDRGERARERAPLLSDQNGDPRSRFEREMGNGLTPVRRAVGLNGRDEDEEEDESER